MLFAERLAELNKAACDNISAPQLAILQRATATLRKSGILQRCLQVGETVPDFVFENTSSDTESTPSRLYDLLDSGPVIINFFRGFWCSFCVAELEAYQALADQLSAKGVHLMAMCPQLDPTCEKGAKGYLVRDTDNQIARSFGIVYQLDDKQKALFASWQLELADLHASDCWELPIPATYLIAQDRTVSYAFVDVDFRKRLDPQELMDRVEALLGQ